MSKLNLVGQRFGRLVVLKEFGSDKRGNILWLCKCDCGNEKVTRGERLRAGVTKSCGCFNKERVRETCFKDLVGKRFGRLLVIKYAYTKGNRVYWECKCDCGNEICVRGSSLTTGNTKSCGCYNLEVATKKLLIHGMKHTRFYNIWCGMKARCHNQNSPKYRIYGARGITVCDRWKNSFLAFKEDMYESYLDHCEKHGENNTSIDRIDVNGNYEPSNCKWATWKEQRANQRRCNV